MSYQVASTKVRYESYTEAKKAADKARSYVVAVFA